MKCRDCGFEVSDKENFCPNCGSGNIVDQDKYNAGKSSVKDSYYDKYYGSRSAHIYINPRNIPLSIFLTFITCGIYGIIWTIEVTRDISALTTQNNDKHDIPIWPLFVTCGIYDIVLSYVWGQKIDTIKSRFSKNNSIDSSLLYILLTVFGLFIVTLSLMQNEINKEANRMNNSST